MDQPAGEQDLAGPRVCTAPRRAGSDAQPRAWGMARPCEPASGSRGTGCSSGSWFCSTTRFPGRTAQPQAASPDSGAAWPREPGGCSQHNQPTPGADRLSRRRLLAQRKPASSEGRRDFRTARVTMGMLTASTAIAALSLRPGRWKEHAPCFQIRIFLVHPSSNVFHARAPSTHPEDLRLHKTRSCRADLERKELRKQLGPPASSPTTGCCSGCQSCCPPPPAL